MEDRITELETRLEFQDQTIAHLSDELAAQQQEIAQLSKTLNLLIAQFSQQGFDALDMIDEKDEPPPPHY